MKIVVLAKQVPDTANVGADAMKEDGTVNRAVLSPIFNPDDLHALELALELKDRYEDVEVSVITMGPPKATEVLKDSLYRGADRVFMASDMKFAGSDTLATSLILKNVIANCVPDYDLIFAGRQAIDGDTAQVGPQIAEKLNIPQVTFVSAVEDMDKNTITAARLTDQGTETVKASFPALLTIEGGINNPRPARIKRMLRYKNAKSTMELSKMSQDDVVYIKERGLEIPVVTFSDIEVDPTLIGLQGSPTRVKGIESVVFQSVDSKEYTPDQSGVNDLINDLVSEYIIG